jgi:hypothetical protein
MKSRGAAGYSARCYAERPWVSDHEIDLPWYAIRKKHK